jgi:hypothetical protein
LILLPRSRLGVRADIFNVGSLRRKLTAGKQNFDFFDANNASAKQQREELAANALRSALEWLESGGEVAIFDATNTTRDRRASVLETCREFSPDVHVIFIESICNDAQVLESNFMQKVTNSPDYKEMALEDAMADLRYVRRKTLDVSPLPKRIITLQPPVLVACASASTSLSTRRSRAMS